MSVDIERLSMEELLELNRRIIHRFQYLRSLKTSAELDKVEGIVVRVNRKTVSVKTKDSRWTIPPKFLTRTTGTVGVPLTIEDILGERKDG